MDDAFIEAISNLHITSSTSLSSPSSRIATPEPVIPSAMSITSTPHLTTSPFDPTPPEPIIQPFRFFDLPLEIRLQIYTHHLVLPGATDPDPYVIDLNSKNHKHITPRLALLRTNHQVHDEACRVFYQSHVFRLFPTEGRFHRSPHPLLARLPPKYRSALTSVELRLGPSFTGPPKGWAVTSALGLEQCVALRTLRVFVEMDPTHENIRPWTPSEAFYTDCAREWLEGVLGRCGAVQEVVFDAWPSVSRKGALMTALLEVCETWEKRIRYGPLRGWDRNGAEEEVGAVGLEDLLEGINI